MGNNLEMDKLAKASKRAALMTLLGVLIVVSSFVYSFFQLRSLDRQIEEKREVLGGMQDAFRDYNSRVASRCPELPTDTLDQVIKANPKAAEALPLVYIQFKGGLRREIVQELRVMLNEQGFPAPGVERVDRNYDSSVRYFYEEDKDLAKDVAQKAKSFFESKGCMGDFPPEKAFTSPQSKAKRGQIEIWINLNCRL